MASGMASIVNVLVNTSQSFDRIDANSSMAPGMTLRRNTGSWMGGFELRTGELASAVMGSLSSVVRDGKSRPRGLPSRVRRENDQCNYSSNFAECAGGHEID